MSFELATVCAVVASSVVLYFLAQAQERKRLPPGPRPWPIVANLFFMVSGLPQIHLEKLAAKYGGGGHVSSLGVEAMRRRFHCCSGQGDDPAIQRCEFLVPAERTLRRNILRQIQNHRARPSRITLAAAAEVQQQRADFSKASCVVPRCQRTGAPQHHDFSRGGVCQGRNNQC